MEQEAIKAYYENAELWLPYKPQWRLFKVLLPTNQVRNIPNQIRSKEDLRKWLLRFRPITVWYSVAQWTNPIRLRARGRENYKVADNILVNINELPFDFDDEIDLERTRKDALKVIKYMKSKREYELKYSVFSGNRGVQILYCRNNLDFSHKWPWEREQAYHNERLRLTEEILTEVFHVPNNEIYTVMSSGKKVFNTTVIKVYTSYDPYISIDCRRVVKLPLSISKSGNLASFIDLNKPLKNQIKNIILESPNFDASNRIGILGNEGVFPRRGMQKDRARIRSPAYYKFITNRIQGCRDDYITMLKFRKDRYKKGRLINLGNMYNLKDWYIFDSGDYIWAINLKSVSRRRLEKIMKKSDACNVGEFLKYGHTHFRSSSMSGFQEPKIIEVILRNESGAHSRPHAFFMDVMGVKTSYTDLCGKEKQGCFDGVVMDG